MSNFLKRLVTGLLLVALMAGMWLYTSPFVLSVMLGVVAVYSLIVEWPQFKCMWLTPLYPLLPYILLIYLNQSVYRSELVWLLCVAVVHDSGAYVFGNLIGSHKLWPQVSPGKTWEGAVAGTILAIVASWLAMPYVVYSESFLLYIPIMMYGVLAFMVNVACMAGDLFESWLKRRAHIKDSGSILPGHGGVLDRLDSLLGAIVVWSLVHFFIKYF